MGILEGLSEAAQSSKNPVLLTEYVRQSIRRAIVQPLVNAQGEVPAYVLDPSLERAIEASVEHGELNSVLTMAPDAIRDVLARLGRKIEKSESAVVIASAGCRHFVRQMMESSLPNVTVLSHNEIPPEVKVRSRGMIE